MSKHIVCCFSSLFIFFNVLYAQQKSFSTIEETLNYHITELKSNVAKYDNIFVTISLDSSMILPQGALKVNYLIDAKLLNKGDKNFIVRFILSSSKDYTEIKAINFQLIKQSKKKVRWINLGNGQSYKIVKSS